MPARCGRICGEEKQLSAARFCAFADCLQHLISGLTDFKAASLEAAVPLSGALSKVMQGALPPARPPGLRSLASTASDGLAAQEAVAAAAVAAAVDAAGPSCRICWQEADDDQDGELLAPCLCSGSSRFVHRRCLMEWMRTVAEQKGVVAAQQCDVCRAPYELPRDMRLRESPRAYVQRQAQAALATRIGNAATWYAAGSIVFATVCGVHGVWLRCGSGLPACCLLLWWASTCI